MADLPAMPDLTTPVQNPLTLVMTIKSPESAETLRQLMPAAQWLFAEALDSIGTAHFTRLVLLPDSAGNVTRLAYMATYDGSLYDFVNALIDTSGELLDQIFEHIVHAPPLPVCENRAEILQYVQAHDVPAAVWYSAYPTLTLQDIKASAAVGAPATAQPDAPAAAGGGAAPPSNAPVSTPAVQLPLCSVMLINSPTAAGQLKHLMQAGLPQVLRALGTIGTVHFGRFVFFERGTQFAIITDFDGPFDAYIRAFVQFLGPIFDGMLGLVQGGAAVLPVEQNTDAFLDYVRSTDKQPGAWYSAYPTLTVQNILARASAP